MENRQKFSEKSLSHLSFIITNIEYHKVISLHMLGNISVIEKYTVGELSSILSNSLDSLPVLNSENLGTADF